MTLAVAIAIAVGAAVPSAVAASSASGEIGPWSPPVVNCDAGGPAISVVASAVEARNATSGWDRQYVVYTTFLWKWNGSTGAWDFQEASLPMTAYVSDDHPMVFAGYTFRSPVRGTPDRLNYYQATARLDWVATPATIGGSLQILPLDHRIVTTDPLFQVVRSGQGWCAY